jgi:hypothetical protein
MDMITQLPDSNGFDCIVTFTDLYSKMVHCVPTVTTVTAEQLARIYLNHVYKLHGLTRVIVSDRDSKFTSEFWTSVFALLGTKLNISTAFHPQTDGQSERTNRTTEQVLRAYCHQQHARWVDYLDIAEFSINIHKNASTQFCPFETVYGFVPDTIGSLAVGTSAPETWLQKRSDIQKLVSINMSEAKLFQQHYANKRVRDAEFHLREGETLRVGIDTHGLMLQGQPSHAFKQRFIGPYEIVEKLSPQVYRLKLPDALKQVHPTFHISKLRLWKDSIDPERYVSEALAGHHADLARGELLIDNVYDVKLAPHKDYKHGDALQFHVHWHGFDKSEDTWEPYKYLKDVKNLDDFFASTTWITFRSSSDYQDFARKYRSRCPEEFRPAKRMRFQ